MAALPPIAALLFAATGWIGAPPPDTAFVEAVRVGTFQGATRLTVGPQAWTYVVDADRNALLLFKDLSSSPMEIGGYGWTPTSFDQPTGVSTDGLSVYVSDYGNHRVQRFDRNLNALSALMTRDTSYTPARFGYPAGVALSRSGDLFIIDGENLRVLKFDARSRFERAFGGIEDGRGAVRRPLKIVVTPDDRVFVLEPDRVLEYDVFGNYVRTIGAGTFHDARGFDVSGDGVLVAAQRCLFWFSRAGEVVRRLAVSGIVMSESVGEIQDVAFSREYIYLLDPRSLIVLKVIVHK